MGVEILILPASLVSAEDTKHFFPAEPKEFNFLLVP